MLEVSSMLSVRSVVMDLFELRTAVDLLHGTERESDRQLRLTQLGELAGTIMHDSRSARSFPAPTLPCAGLTATFQTSPRLQGPYSASVP